MARVRVESDFGVKFSVVVDERVEPGLSQVDREYWALVRASALLGSEAVKRIPATAADDPARVDV